MTECVYVCERWGVEEEVKDVGDAGDVLGGMHRSLARW